ncbi:MAG: response regulator transcription factor [Pseudomonadota bacterium]
MSQDVPFDPPESGSASYQAGSDASVGTPGRGPVLMVEDHPLFADALELTLEGGLGVRDVRRASTLAQALAALDAGLNPETIVLDLGLPDTSGIDGLSRVRDAAPGSFLIVVTSFDDPRLGAAVIAAGANGLIHKSAARDVLASSIRRVWAGERVAPADALARVDGGEDAEAQDAADADAARRLSTLTVQQARILDLVCQGMLNKQIAFELDIAETTVKAHISAILRKLGVQSRTQAVLAAQKVRFDQLSAVDDARN